MAFWSHEGEGHEVWPFGHMMGGARGVAFGHMMGRDT